MKTAELTGAALDWAVGTAMQLPAPYWYEGKCAQFSTHWAQGGPIIERYRITIQFDGDGIRCDLTTDDGGFFVGFDEFYPLIAAMRCYVASKLGDEVELPSVVEKIGL